MRDVFQECVPGVLDPLAIFAYDPAQLWPVRRNCLRAASGWSASSTSSYPVLLLAFALDYPAVGTAVGLAAAGWYPIAQAQTYAQLPGRSSLVRAITGLGAPFEAVLPAIVGFVAARFGLLAGLPFPTRRSPFLDMKRFHFEVLRLIRNFRRYLATMKGAEGLIWQLSRGDLPGFLKRDYPFAPLEKPWILSRTKHH